MMTRHLFLFALLVPALALAAGCATTVPQELVDARHAYRQASNGPAVTLAPAELHVANKALAKAEQSFLEDPDTFETRDLAYVAQRKAELATVTASIAAEQNARARSQQRYEDTQTDLVNTTKADLRQSRTDLEASQRSGDEAAANLAAEQQARRAAEERTATAVAALAELAAVKDEPRGLVITIATSALFSGKRSSLLPAARARLDRVTEVLLASSARRVTIEGHTDSRGTADANMDLSQRRADAVRDHIIKRGYEASLIEAHGRGAGQPIGDNGTVDGRTSNQRIEIVVSRETRAASRE